MSHWILYLSEKDDFGGNTAFDFKWLQVHWIWTSGCCSPKTYEKSREEKQKKADEEWQQRKAGTTRKNWLLFSWESAGWIWLAVFGSGFTCSSDLNREFVPFESATLVASY